MKLTKKTIHVAVADDGTTFEGADAKDKCKAYEKDVMPGKQFDLRVSNFLNIHLGGTYSKVQIDAMFVALRLAVQNPKAFSKLTDGLKLPKPPAAPKKADKPVTKTPKAPVAPVEPKDAEIVAAFVSASREDWKLPITVAQYNLPTSELLKLIPENVLKSCREAVAVHKGLRKMLKAPSSR